MEVRRPPEDIAWMEGCDICGRWLVTAYKDNGFDIAGKARVMTKIAIDMRSGRVVTPTAIPVRGTAMDMRWSCRIRRWYRRLRP